MTESTNPTGWDAIPTWARALLPAEPVPPTDAHNRLTAQGVQLPTLIATALSGNGVAAMMGAPVVPMGEPQWLSGGPTPGAVMAVDLTDSQPAPKRRGRSPKSMKVEKK